MTMGFNSGKNTFIKDLIVPKDFTNAIFFGRTGSGKTTGAILPNIENRIISNYGMLIYDFKGNLHLQTKYLANKHNRLNDIIEVGKPWGKSINVMSYLSQKQVTEVVSIGSSHDDYWDQASKNLLETVYTIYKNAYILNKEFKKAGKKYFKMFDDEPSYSVIFSKIKDVKTTSEFYFNMKEETLKRAKILFRNLLNEDNIYPKLGVIEVLIDELEKSVNALSLYESVDVKDNSGKNAVVNHLTSMLINIATKEYLNKNDIDIIEALREGKIVILNVSSLNEESLNILNLAIYSRLQNLYHKEFKPVSIIIDEAQKVLSKNYLPEVDVCRESKFEYIFATQDEVLLKNKLTENKADELFANVVNRFSFATNNNEIEEAFEYINLDNNRKAFVKPIFVKEEEIVKVEYKYQKQHSILNFSDFIYKKEYYLDFDAKLIEEYKLIARTIDKKIIFVDYILPLKEETKNKIAYLKQERATLEKEQAEENKIDLNRMAALLNGSNENFHK